MQDLLQFLQIEYLGNRLLDWSLGLLVFLITFTVLPIVKRYIGALRKRGAGNKHPVGLELAMLLVTRTTRLFLWALAVWIGLRFITLPLRFENAADSIILVLSWFQAGIWGASAVGYFIDRRRTESAGKGLTGSLNIAEFVGRTIVWALILLLALDNLGVDVTALIAGLGIGGIAIALAVQTVLGDLLASLSIALDKPFAVGDFLSVGSELGTVERIGIKSTRVRSLSGEQIIFSNADLLGSRVRNFGRMYERRVVFSIGVTYETPREKLRRIPDILKAAVTAQKNTRFDRAHFNAYGDFALNFETVYYVLGPDYNMYMDVHQAINFQIHEEFEKLGVEFAYPTQKLFLAGAVQTDVSAADD